MKVAKMAATDKAIVTEAAREAETREAAAKFKVSDKVAKAEEVAAKKTTVTEAVEREREEEVTRAEAERVAVARAR